MRASLLTSLARPASTLTLAVLAASQVHAQTTPASVPAATSSEIVVTAKRLNDARESIKPSLGATTYTLTTQAIQALPGGDNQQFNQIMLQLPGVVQDGFGQFHVRDDHNNLQYRINGTILPEGIAVFGQTLSPAPDRAVRPADRRAARAIRPAHRRHHRHHDQEPGSTMAARSRSMAAATTRSSRASNMADRAATTNYFVSGDYRHNDARHRERRRRAHRAPRQDRPVSGASSMSTTSSIDEQPRLASSAAIPNQYFQIPNPRGLHPTARLQCRRR